MSIELDAVSKSFGAVEAIRNVSLTIGQGEMFGLIGHNGAGKSTLFKLMLGLLPASAGAVRMNGVPTSSAQFRQVRRRIGYLPESFVSYDNLSGLEVLQLFADLKQVARAECGRVLRRVGLAHAASRRLHTYSKGMRQRLGFAQVLLGDPELIFLDEPTNGLDPEGIADFYGILHEAQGRGATIVITSHILADIQDRVDRLVILDAGKVAALGTLADLRSRQVLPSHIEVRLPPGGADKVGPALAHLAGVTIILDGEHATIACAAALKAQVVAALAPMLLDVSIREPSLEDLFLGYGGHHARAH
ncbi:ABC transporter ATP-binding protein [Massilia atriviolacea]|uniref:ABC transporter ATP-binding protein n=1 Tax=Massilia atriviolacea TaxID=2495579 RepID=A0A430HFS7_9BURK|nr:ABC transporter ATP-binding protein [Massilia atriviolacea]RSZ56363.1 ABC transporter ATP-binding protein [Massilia atriviolacea]